MTDTQVITLTKKSDIKTVRKIKQYTHTANLYASRDNMRMFEYWTSKANAKRNELRKNHGIVSRGHSVPLIVMMQDTCTMIAIIH
jgi:hypothetical protein